MSEIVGSLVPLGMGKRLQFLRLSGMSPCLRMEVNKEAMGRKGPDEHVLNDQKLDWFHWITTPEMRKYIMDTLLGDHSSIKIFLRAREIL